MPPYRVCGTLLCEDVLFFSVRQCYFSNGKIFNLFEGVCLTSFISSIGWRIFSVNKQIVFYIIRYFITGVMNKKLDIPLMLKLKCGGINESGLRNIMHIYTN